MSIKKGNITLEKAAEQEKEFKSEIKEIVKGSQKSEDQKSAMSNIKTLYESREKVIRLFYNCSKIVSDAINKK